ncbi:MAG: aminopeptidase P family protein [Candidatus Aminicenantes bacterium]|nr:aminopeptidase P family protein [Candidatus Aminicenantes bacterium]
MVSRRDFLKAGGASVALSGFVREALGQTTPPPGAEIENMLAGVEPLKPEDYEARQEKARRLMARRGLDGLFLPGGANLVYFTSVSWGASERTFGAVLNAKGAPVWVCPAFERERALESVPAGQDVRIWEEHESPYGLVGGIMKDWGAAGGRLGLAPNVSAFQFYGLRTDAPGLELVDGAGVTEGCRGTKTAKEIAFMDLANRITKLAYREAFRGLRAGMTPRELASSIASAHGRMGVSGGGGPQFGPNTAFPHGSRTPRTLEEGMIVMVDGGCGVEGYRSDVTRTVVFGRPTDKMARVWDIVRKSQEAALKAARPGVACQAVDAAARKVIEDAGFGPGYKYFAHRLGHGIGLEGHEYPYLVKGNALNLEPGMTFSNEPGIYIYGEFGCRTEDCLVVTEDGARHLGGLEAVSITQPFPEI